MSAQQLAVSSQQSVPGDRRSEGEVEGGGRAEVGGARRDPASTDMDRTSDIRIRRGRRNTMWE